jgi:hypothetical protein
MTTPRVAPSKPARVETLAALLITLAIAGLHGCFLVHAGGLWRDEVNVVNLAGRHTMSAMALDSFPILLPLLIKVWAALGLAGGDVSLRMVGGLIGLGLTGALWLAAWSARRAAPLLSLTLLGLNGTVIFWGDSLRAFGLGSVLIVLALAALCRLLEKPTWGRAGVLALAAVLSVQALYQNAVLFASIGLGGWVICWLRRDAGAALKILAAGLAALVSLLPYVHTVVGWTSATNVVRPGFSFMAASGNLTTVTAFPLPQFVWVWVLLALLVFGLGLAALFRTPPESRAPNGRLTTAESRALAATILLASLAGYFGFLYYAALITEPWYFLPLVALAAICFDLALSAAALKRTLRVASVGAVAATAAIAVLFAARDLNCRMTNMDLVAKYLDEKISAQDYVVVTPWYMGISFERYYRGAAAWDTLPPVSDHSMHRFDLVPASTNDLARAMQPVLDRMGNTLQGGHRVWVVGWMHVPAPGRRALSAEGRLLAEHSQSFDAVDLKIQGQTSDYEDVGLLRASGWQVGTP